MSLITTHPVRHRISVHAVRAVLEDVVADQPGRADLRPRYDTRPHYIRADKPANLIAEVLTRLGFSVGVLKALDAEHPTGSLVDTGVTITESRHPALKRLTGDALGLLGYVQRRQEAGARWESILRDAFRPARLFRKRDGSRRPWLPHR